MNQAWIIAGLGTVLSGVLTWQLIGGPPAPAINPPARSASGAAVPARPASSAAVPAGLAKPAEDAEPAGDVLDEAAKKALARPLFSRTRRPEAERETETAAETVKPNGLPRLSGVIVGPTGRHALFSDANSKVTARAEGDTMGEFTIRRILPGIVVLMGPEGERVLYTAYAKTPGAAK